MTVYLLHLSAHNTNLKVNQLSRTLTISCPSVVLGVLEHPVFINQPFKHLLQTEVKTHIYIYL